MKLRTHIYRYEKKVSWTDFTPILFWKIDTFIFPTQSVITAIVINEGLSPSTFYT